MVRLPDRYSLSGPESLRSGRQISSADTTAIGRGMQSLGGAVQQAGGVLASIAAREKQKATVRQNLDANVEYQRRVTDITNSFDRDADYGTFRTRAGTQLERAAAEVAQLIEDPSARDAWLKQTTVDAIGTADRLGDLGARYQRQDDLVKLDEAGEAQRRIYVDPNSTEEQRNTARAKLEGMLEVAKGTGLLLPDEYAARKRLYLEEADVTRGLLLAEADPNAIVGPSNPLSLLRSFEGMELESYPDTGGPDGTQYSGHRIGYGSDTITKADGTVVRVKPGMVITQADAERDLARRVADFQSGIIGDVGASRWEALPDHVKSALTSVAYNYGDIGPGGANIAEAVKTGDVETIARAVEGLSGHNGGVNAKRRAREAAIIRGDYAQEWMERLSPEDRLRVVKTAETRRTQAAVDNRGAIEVAVQNAPTAIQNTGTYTGVVPTSADFVNAYGPIDGAQRAAEFDASLEVSRTAYDFRTAPTDEIIAAVEAARPRSTGDDAALETARYETVAKAADQTIKARNADPAAFAQQAFPAVAEAWQAADTPEGYQRALAVTASAQQQLGITEMRLLPDTVAKNAVAKFKDENLSEAERISVATQAVMMTPDPVQRRAVFDQLVDEGMPAAAEGAFEALARGDSGAAQRLFQAAMVDISKLPGATVDASGNKITVDKINQEVQARLLDQGQVGDIYYGLTNGDALNFERAQRDATLITNSVSLRIRNGETIEQAIAGVQADLFGDVVPMQGNNWSVLLEKDVDQAGAARGFEALLPTVRQAVEAIATLPPDLDPSNGANAVISSVAKNQVEAVMANGYFRNAGDGFAFIDPFTGEAVSDSQGRPIIFGIEQVMGASSSAPDPASIQDEYQRQLEQGAGLGRFGVDQ